MPYSPVGPNKILEGQAVYAQRQALANDPHRPRYHFLPPANWINDPNGLIQWGGLTHLFYQFNPNGPFHDAIHWGHAASKDLIHWEHWPIALSPTPGGPDQDGCWSGCAVDNNGTPTLIYTGLEPQVQCLATSVDGLKTWQKHPQPIISVPPGDLDIVGSPDFRDPFVWREDDAWLMAVGTGIRGKGGAVLLYRSHNLIDWQYLNVLHSGVFAEGGEVWECPNLFGLGDRHVLLVSEQPEFKHTYYQLGTYEAHRFVPACTGKTDHGCYFYAALTLEDAQKRRLMWGWLKEGRKEASQRRAGWSGMMSLPRVLRVEEDALEMSPAHELEALRDERWSIEAVTLAPGSRSLVWNEADNAYELYLEVEFSPDAVFALTLCASPDEREKTVIRYDATSDIVTLDALQSSLQPDTEPERVSVRHARTSATVCLRVFVDRSVIETFIDKRTCITSRVYPTLPTSSEIWLECLKGSVNLEDLTVWRMRSIWN